MDEWTIPPGPLTRALPASYALLCQGSADAGLRMLCHALADQWRISQSLPATAWQALWQDWPVPGVTWRDTAQGPRPMFRRPRYSTGAAVALWRLCASWHDQWFMSPANHAQWNTDRALERVLACRPGLALAALREAQSPPLAWLASLVARCPSRGGRCRHQAVVMSQTLGEPLAVSRTLLAAQAVLTRRYRRPPAMGSRWRCRGSGSEPGPGLLSQLERLRRQGNGSLLLVGLHFGAYERALQGLLAARPRNHRHLLLVQHAPDPARRLALRQVDGRQGGASVEILLRHQCEPLALVAALRGGDTTLVMFADLPPGPHSVTPVRLLGRSAWLPRGLMDIAALAGVPIQLWLTSPIHPARALAAGCIPVGRQSGESLAAAGIRLGQRVADVLGRQLRRQPAQWRFLPHLSHYFSSPNGCDPLGL